MIPREKQIKAFDKLLNIMDEIREKCPWDKKQTIQSLRHLTIEETYELGDAILENDMAEIKKELGDLLLHIVFYAKIASEKNDFDIGDVINGINKKLIHRHPHVFGDPENSGKIVKVETEEEVAKNWEKLKLKEGRKSILEGVPKSLPALIKSSRIQDKAASAGFDWDRQEQVFEKVQEEIKELQYEVENNTNRIESEYGDVLFSLINYARFINIDPESALERTNKKFINRFQFLEKEVLKEGKQLSDLSLSEMDVHWEKSKIFFK